MWIFLSNAFLSIVDKGDPTGETLLVRARIPRDLAANAIAEAVRDIRYGNFGDQVKEASRHGVYLDVWQTMDRFQRKCGR